MLMMQCNVNNVDIISNIGYYITDISVPDEGDVFKPNPVRA